MKKKLTKQEKEEQKAQQKLLLQQQKQKRQEYKQAIKQAKTKQEKKQIQKEAKKILPRMFSRRTVVNLGIIAMVGIISGVAVGAYFGPKNLILIDIILKFQPCVMMLTRLEQKALAKHQYSWAQQNHACWHLKPHSIAIVWKLRAKAVLRQWG